MKMMKFNFISLMIIAITFSSCEKESNILVPSDSDSELQKKLVGTWQSEGNITLISRTITFRSNYTFLDSAINFIAEGHYSIKDSFLVKSNVIVKYVNYDYLPYSFVFVFPSKFLKLSDNSFIETPVREFAPINVNTENDIWGAWSTIIWICKWRGEPYYIGRVKEVYNFDEDLRIAFWWSEYLDPPTYVTDTVVSNNMKYNPPFLDIWGNGEDSVEVTFKGNKMYWWQPYNAVQYNRIK